MWRPSRTSERTCNPEGGVGRGLLRLRSATTRPAPGTLCALDAAGPRREAAGQPLSEKRQRLRLRPLRRRRGQGVS
eukprot:4812358-Prymnesium_polylepis.1